MNEDIDTADTSCLLCIDGMTPVTSPVLGHAFRVCPACQPGCPCCGGAGCFPAWTNDMAVCIAAFNEAGLIPALCHTCGGVVGAALLDEEPPQ